MFKKMREILDIIIYLIVIAAIFYVGFAIFFPQYYSNVARYKSFVVVSDSMSPKIEPMSLIIVDKRPDTNYAINDIITFKHDIDKDGKMEIITHRIAKIESELDITFKTRPESVERIDDWTIPKRNVIGKVYAIVPIVGLFILGLQKVAMPVLIISNLIIITLIWQTYIRWENL